VTLVNRLPTGEEIATQQPLDHPGNYVIDPIHRLFCDKLPGGCSIDLDLATVVPNDSPLAHGMWRRERLDPTYITVRIGWTERGHSYWAERVVDLKVPQ
jgi:hypothetical protein